MDIACLATYGMSIGVLESPEDFESSDDLYEAVGGMIGEAAAGPEEREGEGEEEEVELHIRWICDQLFSAMKG